MSAGYIVPEDFFENYDPETQMIGTGPYVFGEYKPDTSLTMTRFDDYWGDKPYFTDLTWLFVDRRDRRAQRARGRRLRHRGRRRRRGDGPRSTASRSNPDFQVAFDSSEVSYMFLNVNKPELQDDPGSTGDRLRHRSSALHRRRHRRVRRSDVPDGGAGQRALQQRLLPVPVRPGEGPGAARRGRRVRPPPRLPVRHRGLPPGGDGDHDRPVRRRRHHPRHPGPGPDDVARPDVDAGRLRDRARSPTRRRSRSTAATGAASPSARAPSSASPSSRTCSSSSDQHTDRDEYIAAMAELTNTFSDLAWVIPMFAPKNPELGPGRPAGDPADPDQQRLRRASPDVGRLNSRLAVRPRGRPLDSMAPGRPRGRPGIIWPPGTGAFGSGVTAAILRRDGQLSWCV